LQFAVLLLERFRAGAFGATWLVRQAGSDARGALLAPPTQLRMIEAFAPQNASYLAIPDDPSSRLTRGSIRAIGANLARLNANGAAVDGPFESTRLLGIPGPV
jgi:hypothetical protein